MPNPMPEEEALFQGTSSGVRAWFLQRDARLPIFVIMISQSHLLRADDEKL